MTELELKLKAYMSAKTKQGEKDKFIPFEISSEPNFSGFNSKEIECALNNLERSGEISGCHKCVQPYYWID